MRLKEETIKELGQIISEDYGVELTFEKTAEMARELTGYFDLLAKIHHEGIESSRMPDMGVCKKV